MKKKTKIIDEKLNAIHTKIDVIKVEKERLEKERLRKILKKAWQ